MKKINRVLIATLLIIILVVSTIIVIVNNVGKEENLGSILNRNEIKELQNEKYKQNLFNSINLSMPFGMLYLNSNSLTYKNIIIK